MIKQKLKRITLLLIGGAFGASLLLPKIAHASAAITISSCPDLQKIGTDDAHPLDGSYILVGNIDCSLDLAGNSSLDNEGQGFAPIGSEGNDFTGTFDGQGFSIMNLSIARPEVDDVGVFGFVDGATIKNVNITGSVVGDEHVGSLIGTENGVTLENINSSVEVEGYSYVGGIIGFNNDEGDGTTLMTKVRFSGSVTGSLASIAGLIGDSDGDATITESSSTGNVSVTETDGWSGYIGGLIGDSDGILTISKSFATGSISGDATSDSVGGLVGWSAETHISDSYATGSVTGNRNVGGLIGIHDGDGNIDNSYSAGEVSGAGESEAIYGFIGANYGTTSDSFWNVDTSNQDTACNLSCDTVGDLSDDEMKTSTPFTDAGWDFTNIWHRNNNINSGYPYLVWWADNSVTNSVTGKKAELVVADQCKVNSMNVISESANSAVDSDYNYPAGMMNFSISCGTNGFTAQITQYFYGVSTGQSLIARKYNPSTKTYTTIPGAVISYVTIDGQSVAKIVYALTDGSSLDSDGTPNGTIVDPSGLALSAGAPNTGYGKPASSNKPALYLLTVGTIGLVLGIFLYRRQKSS